MNVPTQELPLRSLVVLLSLLTALSVSAAGCLAAQPRSKSGEEIQKKLAVTENQVRLRLRSLVGPMCGQVEQSADAIIAGTTDRQVKLAAMQWKINAVPALREALFQPEPVTAALDTLVLCMQMTTYFEQGPGKQALGPASAQAAATCRAMQEQLIGVMASASVAGENTKAIAFATKWAAEHPIRHSISDRESLLTEVFDPEVSEALSAGQAIAEATTTMDDMVRRVEVYSSQLFRQAHWEAERVKLELVAELRADQAIPLAERAVKSADQAATAVDRLAPALERGMNVAQDIPKVVASEREAAMNSLHEEISRALQGIHGERITALDQLGKERGIALQELGEALDKQRRLLTSDADQIAMRRIDYTWQHITRLATFAMTMAVVAALLSAFLFRWILGRRPTR
jgi:hypothetical protein